MINGHTDTPPVRRGRKQYSPLGAQHRRRVACLKQCTGACLQAARSMPISYLYSVRLERACRMPEGQPGIPIHDVAARCGFSNHSHVSRTFEARYGTAPREYSLHRESAKKEAPTIEGEAI
ncbi:helix-turn-helix domain-containing protein [Paraburkholderia sp. 2C]